MELLRRLSVWVNLGRPGPARLESLWDFLGPASVSFRLQRRGRSKSLIEIWNFILVTVSVGGEANLFLTQRVPEVASETHCA